LRKPKVGDRIRVTIKEYVGNYEIGDEYEVLEVFDDWGVRIVGNDGEEECLWVDEFEIIE
jgi:hypothetical protein